MSEHKIAERSWRGKRHRAKAGSVNVLSAAPYGYRYIKRNETTDACYMIEETQATVVRNVSEWYTVEELSIGGIARRLNERGVSTRFGKSPWHRSTVWGMLRNPAYVGRAAFGKTGRAQRKLVTRPLRQKGGYSARDSANQAEGSVDRCCGAGAGQRSDFCPILRDFPLLSKYVCLATGWTSYRFW